MARPDTTSLWFFWLGSGGNGQLPAAPKPPVPAPSTTPASDPSPRSTVVRGRSVAQQAESRQIAPRDAARPARANHAIRPSEAFEDGVVLASGLTSSELTALLAKRFLLLETVDGPNTVYKLRVPPGTGTAAALTLVRKASPAVVADLNHFYTVADSQSGCSSAVCRPFQPTASSQPRSQPCGPLPTIGIIDTAVDPHSKLFASATVIAMGGTGAEPNEAHGMHVASLLAASADTKVPGLLPTARLIAYNAFSPRNGRDVADAESLVRGISSLVRAGARVINMSLTGPSNAVLEQAIDVALQQNTIIVAAAGNDGSGGKSAFPAAYDGVIAVTAVDDQLQGYGRAAHGRYITLAAPGVRLLTASSQSDADLMSGTSYAAPFVTAAAAVLIADEPNLSPKRVADALVARAKDLGRPGRDETYGWGLLHSSNRCEPGDTASLDRMPRALPRPSQPPAVEAAQGPTAP